MVMNFIQEGPKLNNTYLADPYLQKYLKSIFSSQDFALIDAHLLNVGEKAAGPWAQWSREAELNQPIHTPFSPWGERIDHIETSSGWKNLERAAVEEGIVAIGYERKQKELSRVYQAAVLYLFHPSSAFVSCPLAMSDGAARAIELYGSQKMKTQAYPKLISRDPNSFWTSGQWMTEKTGGSDVSGTTTLARDLGNNKYSLTGTKWFTSATTSQMAMLLARPEGADKGSRGLSLFYIELRDEKNKLKNIEVLRLKNKLGTKALPTAELSLCEALAEPVGELGNGVKKISSLFNITRIYNSVCALGHWRRALQLAWSYSEKRSAFGKKLTEHPLHLQTLTELEKNFEKAFQLTFFVTHLLGKDELGTATPDERIVLRALTPIVKLYTAKKCMLAVSEVIEIFAGTGYIEDSGIPTLLRDAQVFSIWEGTTNVLALDFLRALQKENAGPSVIHLFENQFSSNIRTPELQARFTKLKTAMIPPSNNFSELETQARILSFEVAELLSDCLVSSTTDL